WLEFIERLKNVIGSIFGLGIRPAIDIGPVARGVGPDEQLHALEQAIIPGPTVDGISDIGRQFPRLDTAKDGEAQGLNVEGATPDPIHGVVARAIPRLQVEFPITLTSSLIQTAEAVGQFVAKQ